MQKAAAYILLTSVYSFTYLVAFLGSIIPRRRWTPTGRIIVTGTFHNPNWYLSHVTPLARSGVKEVILVVDDPQLPLERVRFVCPPRWVVRLLSRAGAKAIWMIIAGFRYRPDLYMGYHLAPGACSALLAGKLLGRPSCYQMTAGPVEIIGGGFKSPEGVSNALGHSRLIEKMALAVVRLFDLVVVRGNKAREYAGAQNTKGTVAIITGSIQRCRHLHQADRQIHLVFVGRLSPAKQVNQFIEIVDAVKRVMPNVRAAIVGEGPIMGELQDYSKQLELTDNIEFLGKRKHVEAILGRSKVFMLNSQSEGLSIALIESMAAGAVPVVADVGELGDLVIDGVNGYLIEPNNIHEYTKKALALLQDQALWEICSSRAIEAARSLCDIEVVSEKWRQHLREVISQASGHCLQEVMNLT